MEGRAIFPILLSALMNTCENPINIKENEITLKYLVPTVIVSVLLVNIFIMTSGNVNEIAKNTNEIMIDRNSAMPSIFSTVCLSPFPKYCAHKTDVPIESP